MRKIRQWPIDGGGGGPVLAYGWDVVDDITDYEVVVCGCFGGSWLSLDICWIELGAPVNGLQGCPLWGLINRTGQS